MSASHPGEPPPPLENPPFKIYIRTAAQIFPLEVFYTTTVEELKKMIKDTAQNPDVLTDSTDGRMHLILSPGEDLERYLSLDDYVLGRHFVKAGYTIAVVSRPVVIKDEETGEVLRSEYRLL
ncbi:Putative Ubiquitin-like domain superfamily [Septoria linicola]|uniref:Ubiquitin-like domain superfamily n=1 Tax=Septoria linicola TaxID=215465 RepID=A0A9Q9AJV3_9PEZI|nr:Putative Ubiquitin-like domain superfamily [Septoria linicola]